MFIVEVQNKTSEGYWYPLPETFDTQAQAEQHIIDYLPDNIHARITPSDCS